MIRKINMKMNLEKYNESFNDRTSLKNIFELEENFLKSNDVFKMKLGIESLNKKINTIFSNINKIYNKFGFLDIKEMEKNSYTPLFINNILTKTCDLLTNSKFIIEENFKNTEIQLFSHDVVEFFNENNFVNLTKLTINSKNKQLLKQYLDVLSNIKFLKVI